MSLVLGVEPTISISLQLPGSFVWDDEPLEARDFRVVIPSLGRGDECLWGGGMAARKSSVFFMSGTGKSGMGESVSLISGVNVAARLMMHTNRFNLRETECDVCSKLSNKSLEAKKSSHSEPTPSRISTRSSSMRSRVSW